MAKKTKKRKSARRAKRSGGGCRGTPVKCHIKEGNGTPVLYCGKMRPIELRAGKGGRFVAVGRKGKGSKVPRALKSALIAAATSHSDQYQSDY